MKLLIFFLSTFLGTMNMDSTISPENIYDFKVAELEGGEIDFRDFKGKKILIVNTASECGYTPQYAQLEELYKEAGDKVMVIGFPANDFGGQEPGTNKDIAAFCERTTE